MALGLTEPQTVAGLAGCAVSQVRAVSRACDSPPRLGGGRRCPGGRGADPLLSLKIAPRQGGGQRLKVRCRSSADSDAGVQADG